MLIVCDGHMTVNEKGHRIVIERKRFALVSHSYSDACAIRGTCSLAANNPNSLGFIGLLRVLWVFLGLVRTNASQMARKMRQSYG